MGNSKDSYRNALPSPAWVTGVRFTADGTRLVSAGGAGYGRDAVRKVTVWAVQDGAPK